MYWERGGCWGKRVSIIDVQLGQGKPNQRVHPYNGKLGFAEFDTGSVDPRVGISRFHCTPMIDSYCTFGAALWFYFWRHTVNCKVCHTRSDVRCTKNVSKENDGRSLMFPKFKTFTSLEFRLSAVVALQELGMQYCGAVALAGNVRI